MVKGQEESSRGPKKRRLSNSNEKSECFGQKSSRIDTVTEHGNMDTDNLYGSQVDDNFEEYFESLQTLEAEDAEVMHCTYCNVKVPCIKSNIVKCNIFASVPGRVAEDVLLLYCPNCEPVHRVIAVYITGKWLQTEDILTSSLNRGNGWIKVTTLQERIILFVLNRIIFKQWEIETQDIPYDFHPSEENAKLLWHDNVAIGFYTYKTKGTSVIEYCPYTWQMPAIDTIFIRKQYRRHGYGMSLLDDFRQTFPKEDVGLIQPVSQAMKSVCFKYLSTNPQERDRMWFVVPPAGESYRGNLWLEILGRRRQAERRVAAKTEQSKSRSDDKA